MEVKSRDQTHDPKCIPRAVLLLTNTTIDNRCDLISEKHVMLLTDTSEDEEQYRAALNVFFSYLCVTLLPLVDTR